MNALITSLAVLFMTSAAHADGFICRTFTDDLKIQIYNQVQPSLGTRSAAVMVVSDPNVQEGRKTIAKFTAANGTLEAHSLTYTADVDLRFTDSSRKGELISGTKLGELSQIEVSVEHEYESQFPLVHGQDTTGALILTKRNGEEQHRVVICQRYLKGA